MLTRHMIAAHQDSGWPGWVIAGTEARFVTRRKLTPERMVPGFAKLETMVAAIPRRHQPTL
jgi:hypothetical protein